MNPFTGPYALLAKAIAIALFCAALIGFGAYQMNKWNQAAYDKLSAEYSQFKGGVAALGQAAIARKAVQELHDLTNKRRSDAENVRTTDALRADVKRMRDAIDSGRGGLSSPAPAASSSDRICFDPAKFAGALRSLDEGLLGIVESGSKAVTDLSTARDWAQGSK